MGLFTNLTFSTGSRVAHIRELACIESVVTGETPDISEWLNFEFCDRVWWFYFDQKKIEIDGSRRRLARWLGVAHRVGSDLCY